MPIPTRVTMNFDSHITKVFMYGEGEQNTWTTSGTLFEQFAIGGGPYPVELTFESGYELDTVTVENATVSDKTSTGFSLSFSNNVDVVCTITSKRGGSSMINIDLTTLSGYSTLTKGQTYSITVKAKASGYQDSDASAAVSYTVPQPTLAAPVITASDTTITWDAIENADSYDVYVDDTLYENVTGDTVYDITTTVTNGTYSGDTTITDTATVTITANSGYTLPDTVTVTGASQSWNKETGTLTLTNPTGAVTVSAVCVAAVTYPVKGDLITLDNKTYRVLRTEGSVAEVLAMYNSTTSQKFGSSNNTYANSSLDVYLSQTFYNSLSTAMQNAIVAKTFQQDSWYRGSNTDAIAKYNGTYQTTNNYTLSLMSTTYGSSISRKCYVLSCQDVIDYLEVTTSMGSADTTLTSENVCRMFWNQTTSPGSTYLWLHSARSDSSSSAFSVNGNDGYLDSDNIFSADAVRPAFQIDLSKIEWSPVGGVTEYTATVKIDGSCDAINCPIKLYDGSDANGTLLTTINVNPSVGEVGTFSIKSGSLYIQATNASRLDGAWYQVYVNNETGDTITSTARTEVVPISSNVIIMFVDSYCLTGDTLITLADGLSKRIDQLTLADKVMSYNPYTMLLEPDEITYTDSAEHKTHTEYKIYTFADGTTVKTVHRHRFYNVERQAMVYMDEWKIGEHALTIEGNKIALVKHETVNEEVQHYTIFTKNQNYFANGLLSGNRYTKHLTL